MSNMNQKNTPNSNRHNTSLLVVDDDVIVLATLSLGLRRAGFHVVEAMTGEEAIELCKSNKFDLALFDVELPGLSGVEAAKKVFELAQVPFLFLSAYSDKKLVDDAIEQGALCYLVKPIDVNQLIPTIETALTRSVDIKSMMAHYDNLNTALSQSRETSVAVGLVMAHTSLTAQQAESMLRLYARNTRQKMNLISKSIIEASEGLNRLINEMQMDVNKDKEKQTN